MSDKAFYVDLRLVIDSFNPLTSCSHYYTTFPRMREVVSIVTLQKIIECVFITPANQIHEDGLTAPLYMYIEHNCIEALELFEADSDLLFNFECLINDIVELTDAVLRTTLLRYGEDYSSYGIENWVSPTLAVFREVSHGL